MKARWCLLALAALVFTSALIEPVPLRDHRRAAAQSGPPTTLEEGLDGNLGRIIPRPNSGREPESPSDRGGWLQLSVLGVMSAGVTLIIVLVVRESRKARGGSEAD